jgi:hypothetical protein
MDRKPLATIEITPHPDIAATDQWHEFELSKSFLNPNAGGNFSFGAGMGIAIQLSRTSDAAIEIDASDYFRLRIRGASLDFAGKEINDNVTV